MTEDERSTLESESKEEDAKWILGIFYYDPKDKRIFPPKRSRAFGWTINFANPYSLIAFVLLIAILIVIPFLIRK